MNNKLIGGKFIADGSYGCVHHPNLPCDSYTIDNNWVSKIIHKDSVDDEWTAINSVFKLEEIDPDSKYLIYPKHKCNIESYKKSDELSRCKLLIGKSDDDIKKNYVQLIIPYGGSDLYEYRIRNKPNLETCWISHLNLLKAVYLLNKNNIASRDIKDQNILFHNDVLKLTDFGLATKINPDSTTSKHELDDGWNDMEEINYEYWPLDYTLGPNNIKNQIESLKINSSLYFDNSSDKGTQPSKKILTTYLKVIDMNMKKSYGRWKSSRGPLLNREHRQNFIKTFLQYLMDAIYNNKYTEEEIINRVRNTIDVFSLGVVLSYEVNQLPTNNSEYKESLINLIYKMTSQNPFKRPLIKDVIIIFLDYVETYVDKPGAQAARREWESL